MNDDDDAFMRVFCYSEGKDVAWAWTPAQRNERVNSNSMYDSI